MKLDAEAGWVLANDDPDRMMTRLSARGVLVMGCKGYNYASDELLLRRAAADPTGARGAPVYLSPRIVDRVALPGGFDVTLEGRPYGEDVAMWWTGEGWVDRACQPMPGPPVQILETEGEP